MEPKKQLFEYSSNLLVYHGKNFQGKAATKTKDWIIDKYTYTGTEITQIDTTEGAWDDRATLF